MPTPDAREPLAEAEVKVEIDAALAARLPARLRDLGFLPAGESSLRDTYLEHAGAPGRWDYRRIRELGGRRSVGAQQTLEAERALIAAAPAPRELGGRRSVGAQQTDIAFTLAEKRWTADADGHPVRLEAERSLTPDEARALIAAASAPRVLEKRRTDYRGALAGRPATVSIDALTLNGAARYFIECELLVPPAQAHAAREQITAWLRDALALPFTTEAPTMLDLLLS